jgi:hypothetical protein
MSHLPVYLTDLKNAKKSLSSGMGHALIKAVVPFFGYARRSGRGLCPRHEKPCREMHDTAVALSGLG